MKAPACCLSALLFLTSTGYAAVHSATGAVITLASRDSSHGADWLSLAGVDSFGTCKTTDAGHVVFLVPDDKEGRRMFALALASKTSGTPLTIWVDDTVTDPSGFCLVSYMEME
jgi:hypothetical protein